MQNPDRFEMTLNSAQLPVLRAGWANIVLVLSVLAVSMVLIVSRELQMNDFATMLGVLVCITFYGSHYSRYISRISVERDRLILVCSVHTCTFPFDHVQYARIKKHPWSGSTTIRIKRRDRRFSKVFIILNLLVRRGPVEQEIQALSEALQERGITVK